MAWKKEDGQEGYQETKWEKYREKHKLTDDKLRKYFHGSMYIGMALIAFFGWNNVFPKAEADVFEKEAKREVVVSEIKAEPKREVVVSEIKKGDSDFPVKNNVDKTEKVAPVQVKNDTLIVDGKEKMNITVPIDPNNAKRNEEQKKVFPKGLEPPVIPKMEGLSEEERAKLNKMLEEEQIKLNRGEKIGESVIVKSEPKVEKPAKTEAEITAEEARKAEAEAKAKAKLNEPIDVKRPEPVEKVKKEEVNNEPKREVVVNEIQKTPQPKKGDTKIVDGATYEYNPNFGWCKVNFGGKTMTEESSAKINDDEINRPDRVIGKFQ